MRDSRCPRGTWTAPGMWPSSHSSCSRTSTTTGSPESISSRAWVASTSEISDADLLQQLSVVGHRYRKYSFAQLASVACDERARQGLDHRGARCRGRRGDRRRRHARDAKRRRSSRSSKPPPFARRPDRAARDGAAGARGAAGLAGRARLGGCGSSPSAIRAAPSSSSSSAWRSRCRASRPTRPGRGRRQSEPSRTPRPPSASQDLRHPEHPARPAAVRPELHAASTSAVESLLLRGAAYQQALRPVSAEREFAAAAKARSERPRGADRGGRRASTTRTGPPLLSRVSARSPAGFPRRRPCASISGSS